VLSHPNEAVLGAARRWPKDFAGACAGGGLAPAEQQSSRAAEPCHGRAAPRHRPVTLQPEVALHVGAGCPPHLHAVRAHGGRPPEHWATSPSRAACIACPRRRRPTTGVPTIFATVRTARPLGTSRATEPAWVSARARLGRRIGPTFFRDFCESAVAVDVQGASTATRSPGCGHATASTPSLGPRAHESRSHAEPAPCLPSRRCWARSRRRLRRNRCWSSMAASRCSWTWAGTRASTRRS
jgi:hypothetical protein